MRAGSRIKKEEKGISHYLTRKNAILFLLSVIIISVTLLPKTNALVLYSEKYSINTSNEGSLITVPFKISNATDLYAFKLDISYDNPGALNFSNFTDGGFLSSDGTQVVSSEDLGVLNSSPGSITNIILSRKSSSWGISGDGVLFNLEFHKLGDAVIEFTVSGEEYSDPDSVSQPYDFYKMSISDESDSQIVYAGQPMTFYATVQNHTSYPEPGCIITLDGSDYPMTFNGAGYEFTATINNSGTAQWSATCGGFYTLYDTYIVQAALGCSEGSTQQCGTSDIGLCSFGNETCVGGVWTGCNAVFSTTEICDGFDNDCDNSTDEGGICASQTSDNSGSSGGGGGGGGGGGPSSTVITTGNTSQAECVPDWRCDAWNLADCFFSKTQTRSCMDHNGCSETRTETRSCGEDNTNIEVPGQVGGSLELCGNGVADQGETEDNCCIDTGCPADKTCSDTNQCMTKNQITIHHARAQIYFILFMIMGGAVAVYLLQKEYRNRKKENEYNNTPGFIENAKKAEDYILQAEQYGLDEKQAEEKLVGAGWPKPYIDKAKKLLKKDKKKR